MPDPARNLTADHCQYVCFRSLRLHRDIADPLSRQGQRLGKGIAGQCIVIITGGIRRGLSVKNNLPVRLIADQENVMPVFLLLVPQKICQPLIRLFGVDHAGRIVGRIDQQRHDAFVHFPLQIVPVDLEMRHIRVHDGKHCPGVPDVGHIFTKIRRKHQHLITRLSHRAQRVCQRSRRPARHKDMLRLVGDAESAAQAIRHDPPHPCIAQRRTVHVQYRWI